MPQFRSKRANCASAIDRTVQEGDLDAISFEAGIAAIDTIDQRYQSLAADADGERQLEALRELDR